MRAAIQFFAIVLTALALIPSGAHIFALPAKIDLAEAEYFTVQAIYRGWALFGIVIVAALVANLAVAFMLRDQTLASVLAYVAALCIALMLVIFLTWTQPANAATANWTRIPDGWRSLRAAWEYSHAVNACVLFIAFCASVLSALVARRA